MYSKERKKTLLNFELVQKDPFRIFFPLGGFLAIAGVLVWVFHALASDTFEYNTMLHKTVMIGGFISSIIAGFLLTAITRFTGTDYATRKELLFQITVMLVSIFSALNGSYNIFFFGSTVFYIGIARFAFLRILKRNQNPPSTFVFVFLGIAMFIVSSFFLGLNYNSSYNTFFEDIYFQGAILSLILGVGSRLLPGIFGHVEIVKTQRKQYEIESSIVQTITKSLFLYILLFLSSFFIEHFLFPEVIIGRLLRAFVISTMALQYWQIQKIPKNKNILTIFLWISAWGIVIGSLLYALFPEFSVSIIHLKFICGFSLMTIMISAKVSIAHGKQQSEEKSNSKLLFLSGVMLVIAGTTRATIDIFEYPINQITIASSFWIMGICFWFLFIFRKSELDSS